MRKLIIGAALASTAFASPAIARDGQWYIGVEGGTMLVEDMDIDITDTAGVELGEGLIEYDAPGFDVGGIVGYDFGGFRMEAEVAYKQDNAELVSGPGTAGERLPASGDGSALSFMVNGMVDFGEDDGMQGFIGGGVGVARTSIDVVGAGTFLDDSDTGFAWQAIAGVRAPLSDSWDVGVKYRFFNHDDVEIGAGNGNSVDGRFRTHSILGSLIYNFGGEEAAPPPPPPPAPPAPPPPPPPPPAPTCNKGPYIVFFDFDKSNITPEAATILDNAVSAYANCNSVPVMLAGHADRAGPASYNVALSQRRADSVKSYMVSKGISASAISTEAFGESKPRVQTADGVRELQNRRVEITYGPGAGM